MDLLNRDASVLRVFMIGSYYMIMNAALLVKHIMMFISITNTNIAVMTGFSRGILAPY